MKTTILEGFAAELEKLAQADVSAEAPTLLSNDPAAAIEGAQGRRKNITGPMPAQPQVNLRKSVPAPETTPPSMLGYIP